MKSILTAFIIMTAGFSAQAAITCTQADYRIDVDGENATYAYTGVKVAEVNNVQVTTTAAGTVYATDIGFKLTVSGNQGVFEGIWPNPMGMYSSDNPLILNCK